MSELFAILADDTRRRILNLLVERDRSVNELVGVFDVSQPAISRHLRVLREAGLVRVRRSGQQRIYGLDAERLAELDVWLAPYRRFWAERLDDLEEHLDEHALSEACPGPAGPRGCPGAPVKWVEGEE